MPPVVRIVASILVLVSLGSVWTGAGAQGEPDAGATTLASDLAFVAPDGRLAWLPAGAERIRRLGSEADRHAFPAFSPDGRRLAVIVQHASGARAVVMDLGQVAAGERARPSEAVWFDEPDAPVIYLDWADDGESLLLLVADAGSGFRLVRADEDDRRTLARGAPLYWDQLWDGGVVVHTGGPSGSRLTTVDEAGRETGELPRPGAFRSPAISPSGRWLAYGSVDLGGRRRAVVVPAPGVGRTGPGSPGLGRPGSGSPDVLSALGHRGVTAFAWHPTRDLLALTRPLSDVPHSFGPLGGLDASSGRFEPWIDEPVVAFWWSPDGRRIAVLTVDAPGGGTVARSDAARRATVLASTGASTGASIRTSIRTSAREPDLPGRAPSRRLQGDGARFRLGILDVESDVTRWLATVTPSRTFLTQELPFFDQYARSHARWSPDGTLLALSVQNASGRESVWIVDVATGTVRDLAPGAMPAWPPGQPPG
ncbi:MAG: hypothetical protein U5J97_00900 [Trueperaceae bacterium]|nr:hypothetical protein [Trueperaceae bacterium]